MIPKTIVYAWYGDKELERKYIDGWDICKDWKIVEINEKNYKIPNEYVQTLIDHKLWTLVSNYMRLYYLYENGGVYLDIDIELVKSLDDLVKDDKAKIGSEDNRRVNTAIMIFPKGHWLLKEAMEVMEKMPLDIRADVHSPQVITDILINKGWNGDKLFELDDLVSYPHEYFYPYHYTEKYTPECIKPNTYCIHHWFGLWIK